MIIHKAINLWEWRIRSSKRPDGQPCARSFVATCVVSLSRMDEASTC